MLDTFLRDCTWHSVSMGMTIIKTLFIQSFICLPVEPTEPEQVNVRVRRFWFVKENWLIVTCNQLSVPAVLSFHSTEE